MKTAVITGGNSGIGKEVAIALAKENYHVIIHGRDAEKTKQANVEIKTASGNDHVDYIVGDISTIKGMKDVAASIKAKTDSIDSLVLSTGVIFPDRVETADGLESMFAIQYLSRFAITQYLLPELQKGKAKIIHVGATKIKNAQIFFDDLPLKNNFSMFKAMGQCMYANYLFTEEFARRYADSGMVMNIGHVGLAKTGIARDSNFLLKFAVNVMGKTPKEAAKKFTYLASDPSVTYSGYSFTKAANSSYKEKVNYDAAAASRLWEESLKLIK